MPFVIWLHENRYICIIDTHANDRKPILSETWIPFTFSQGTSCFSKTTNKTGWWFQICFIFIPTWGNHPIWLIYFSNGLKPPTRKNPEVNIHVNDGAYGKPRNLLLLGRRKETLIPQEFWKNRVQLESKVGTLQGMDTYPTLGSWENHLQNAIFGGIC